MANTSSLVAKTTSLLSGLSQNARLLLAARVIIPGFLRLHSTRGDVIKRRIDSVVLAMTADSSCGISVSECFIDLARLVSLHIKPTRKVIEANFQQHQSTARNRSSVISPNRQSPHRHRADSGGNRVRSDSERTEKLDGDLDPMASHPVEPRARTALLPPIMVSSP